MAGKTGGRRRLHTMDELRGFLILGMILHHAMYTAGYLFGAGWAVKSFDWMETWIHPIGAILFVFISGIASRFSHNNVRRGLILLAIAVGMSVLLYFVMPSAMIWFGILHCLAVCILLYAALARGLSRIPPWITLAVTVFLAVITWPLARYGGSYIGIEGVFILPIPHEVMCHSWLMPLGLSPAFGADYFPLFPWLFVFLAGTVFGRWANEGKFPKFLYKDRFVGLSWIGRHSLWFYLAHQPVIFGLCWLLNQCGWL